MAQPQVVIENPILNSPFAEPTRHFRFSDDGITDEVVDGRRESAYFVPIARPRTRGKGAQAQLAFETEWTQQRVQENAFINRVRGRVGLWRRGGYPGVTRTTARLLAHWTNPERERRLFFCQVEALETIIYITEAARKYGDAWIENELRIFNRDANPLLDRIALKMATGSGKTVVMAMLIAWHTLNKRANTQARDFTDAFLVVTPGITIRDRLRVLLPSDPGNYYRTLDLVPADLLPELGAAKIVVTNFHAFKPRERVEASKLTKQLLGNGAAGPSPFTETPDQMVQRVCRELGNKKSIVVLNDEAHHCYRRRPDDLRPEAAGMLPSAVGEKLTGDARAEAKARDEEARVWISGIEAVRAKRGLRAVYDLSATPFFLRGSGYEEGTLFPWVVSDFSLIDAIEAGIVKVPRVPVADDAMTGESPTYRDLWLRIRDDLPKKGRKTDAVGGEPVLPVELEGALQSLYGNYERAYQRWEQAADGREGATPPVFIVVCNNTNVSKLVFDHVAGWETEAEGPDGARVLRPGKLPLFSNVREGRWRARPNTILIDSGQLESGEAMSADFKKATAREIDEFKAEYRRRFPGRDAEDLSDEDLLREVMNTVGKAGKLGEGVRCVVSVSMLTEGWDANTVTHILGVRAFGTQLLCEQVVGRGLRRVSYSADERGMFPPEYAEVYGVPFSFIPSAGVGPDPTPGPTPTRVRALEDRAALEITFPRLTGYRYDLPIETLAARFGPEHRLALSTADVPTRTEIAAVVGASEYHTLDALKGKRVQEVAYELAAATLERYYRDDEGARKTWLFPPLLRIAKRWMNECVDYKDGTFPGMLALAEKKRQAVELIYAAIRAGTAGEQRIKPILRAYDATGSTRYVDFDTTKATYRTDPAKCHLSHVVADTESWEQKLAQTLEAMPEVVCYAKNQNLGLTIPYVLDGRERGYVPDFLVRLDDGHGAANLLNLLVEGSGRNLREKAAKVAAARTQWVPAINNHGGFGRWAFLEITDPWDAQRAIQAFVVAGRAEAA